MSGEVQSKGGSTTVLLELEGVGVSLLLQGKGKVCMSTVIPFHPSVLKNFL